MDLNTSEEETEMGLSGKIVKSGQAIEGAIHVGTNLARWLSYIGTAAMLLLVCADVFLRNVLNMPILGTVELVELLNAVLVFAALAFVTWRKRHIEITLLVNHLSQGVQTGLSIFAYLLSTIIMGLIAWEFGLRFWETMFAKLKWVTPTLGIIYSPFLLIVSLGCVLMSLEFIIIIVHSVAGLMSQARKKAGDQIA
jgi:TRAP-type C4-dicarboxylate transport system permease small subunit